MEAVKQEKKDQSYICSHCGRIIEKTSMSGFSIVCPYCQHIT